ncbi:hypothetical protein ANAPC5_01410 [Anaplasma phagocytophilum]|nr:hypothetical protein ANAPC5_01410 [Anaplasma phagocytophilum]
MHFQDHDAASENSSGIGKVRLRGITLLFFEYFKTCFPKADGNIYSLVPSFLLAVENLTLFYAAAPNCMPGNGS